MTEAQASISGLVDRLGDLGDPVRLRTLRLLEREELSVGEIAAVLQVPQSTASRHLKVLGRGGWLVSRAMKTATLHRVVADDLPAEALALWTTLRERVDEAAESAGDAARLRDVLAQRSVDSLSFFGRVAGEWDAVRRELFGDGFTAPALLGLLRPDWVVADVGCGTGNAAAALAPHVERVIAIDQSGPMLEAARRRLESEGVAERVELRDGSIEGGLLAPGTVDAVVCSLVLHHLGDPIVLFREAARALRTSRRGGVLVVIDMERHSRQEYRHTMGHAHLGFDEAETAGMFAAAGFGAVRRARVPTPPGAKGPGLFTASGWLPESAA